MACASLINGGFSEAVRVLVPEGCTWRPIAKGPLALQQLSRRGKPSIGREDGRPQPCHGIAEMVDVNDLAEVIWPVRPAIRLISARPAGWRFAAREHRCDRCKEVAPVKARREELWVPVDVPAARFSGTPLDQLE
jgi:hypothetical protein